MEQAEVIEELQAVLDFLKSKQIKNKEALVNIKKPLDDLRASLKYLPIDSSFDRLPNEITTDILNYLCDSNAFIAAAVCLRWKGFLKNRFVEKPVVSIGKSYCGYECREIECLIPSEMLKAAAAHKLDVHLSICDSVRDVDSKIVTDGLTSVSKFSLVGNCNCVYVPNDNFEYCNANPLSMDQLEDLFKDLGENDVITEEVKLTCLDLNELNQDRLVHCLVNKIENLTLIWGKHNRLINVENLLTKLAQESTDIKLKRLTLNSLECPYELNLGLVNALCNVENVTLHFYMDLADKTVKQLLENILTRPVKIKSLNVRQRIDFNTLINPKDLKRLLNKMPSLRLKGNFTLEQVEAARSLPDVKVWERTHVTVICKGCEVFE